MWDSRGSGWFRLDCAALLHSLLLFAQVVTINVAINSSNTSLLTLLISNNFAELKVRPMAMAVVLLLVS